MSAESLGTNLLREVRVEGLDEVCLPTHHLDVPLWSDDVCMRLKASSISSLEARTTETANLHRRARN